MSNQSPSKSDVTNCSATDNSDLVDTESIKDFEWTIGLQKCLLINMRRLKPCGINKHLSIFLLKEKLKKQFDIDLPNEVIWDYLETKWDLKAADILEHISFDTSMKDFILPEEFDQLIAEEGEKIKKLEKESLNDEVHKKKSLNWSGKTRSKSNSMSSVDSKEGLNETIPSTLDSSSAKTSEERSDDGPCTRRSLRTNDKLENSKSDEKNKLKDLKQLNKKISNQSKDTEKIEKISNFRGRKRKSRNVSESSFSSDNSKQRRNCKNNLTDLTISDSSSRSVTPEMLRGRTSNRSVTPETINRKSNLRSNDEDQKSKLALEKACLKFGHNVDLILPEVKVERLKHEKQFSSSIETKSKNLIQNKNEANNKLKGKIRNRVTSDLLVVQQSPEIQSLGRRSCSNKNS
uniref:MRG-binding protein n=1 Tax=Schizaphis graminum TaxID=13262 RepID=A0A2S2NFS2_SCHGA